MASTLIIMEMANLFVGDDDPNNSKHLAIEEVKLPDLTGIFADHMPGGSPAGVEIQVGIQKLEPTFKLKGFDPDLMGRFGYGAETRQNYTIYGVMRDVRSGETKEGMALINGRLGKVAGDAFKRGEAASTDYAINEVMHYEVQFDGVEILYWDFFSGVWRTRAGSNATERALLRIPG